MDFLIKGEPDWDQKINDNFTNLDTRLTEYQLKIGVLNGLETNYKDNLVGAINENTAQMSDIANDVCAKGASPTLSDNTSIIQTELNKKGHVIISRPGTYLVTGLVIYDNTFFELYPGVELKLKDNASNYLLRNEFGLVSDKTNKNINIRIKGGIWNGNSSNNPKTGTWQNGGFPGWGVLLNHVEYIKLEDMFLQDYLKYCFHIIDCANLYTNNIGFNNISDGLHFQPPLKNAFINNTYGTTGDDMIAFTLGDFPNYVVSQEGNFENIIIDGVNADSCVGFVKITGAGLNGAYAFRNISVNNLHGVVTRYIASIIEDRTYDTGGLMYTMCENVSFNHIKASGSCFVIDTYKANLYFNDISIDNAVWFQVSYGGTTPQDVNLIIDGAYSPYGKNIGTAFILLQNNAKIGNLILNNCTLDLNAVPLVKVLTGSTFKLIEINNVICKNVGTGGMYIYEDSGNISEATILINNSVFDGFEKGEMYHTKVKVRHINSELLNTTDRMYLYSTAQVNARDINCGIQGIIYGEPGSSYTLHDPWVSATLINNWSVYGQNTPSYFKDSLGVVHIRGEVTGGAVNTVIFTLPTGYRPSVRMWFPINSNDGNNIYGMIQIAGDGTVKLVTGGTSYLGLVNISFVAEL